MRCPLSSTSTELPVRSTSRTNLSPQQHRRNDTDSPRAADPTQGDAHWTGPIGAQAWPEPGAANTWDPQAHGRSTRLTHHQPVRLGRAEGARAGVQAPRKGPTAGVWSQGRCSAIPASPRRLRARTWSWVSSCASRRSRPLALCCQVSRRMRWWAVNWARNLPCCTRILAEGTEASAPPWLAGGQRPGANLPPGRAASCELVTDSVAALSAQSHERVARTYCGHRRAPPTGWLITEVIN